VLRNSRGGGEPDVVRAARACLDAGAHGITVHPRPDARHIRADDVLALAELTREYAVEFNLEGNPFAPPRPAIPVHRVVRGGASGAGDPGSGRRRPAHLGPWLRFFRRQQFAQAHVWCAEGAPCRVSLFVDAGEPSDRTGGGGGADRIELYTGPYAEAYAAGDARARSRSASTPRDAPGGGLGVNAGHDLSQANLGVFVAVSPVLESVDRPCAGRRSLYADSTRPCALRRDPRAGARGVARGLRARRAPVDRLLHSLCNRNNAALWRRAASCSAASRRRRSLVPEEGDPVQLRVPGRSQHLGDHTVIGVCARVDLQQRRFSECRCTSTDIRLCRATAAVRRRSVGLPGGIDAQADRSVGGAGSARVAAD
jgi:pyridoxine 5-phosphate synthase